MAYERTVWENGITPINAANLNNLEEGVSERLVKEEVWKNETLTSEFKDQTVRFDWSDCDKIGLEYQYSDTYKGKEYVEVACETGARIHMKGSYLSTTRVPQFAEREMVLNSQGALFTQSYVGLASGNSQVSNWYCIPVRIWKIKGVQ